MAIKTLDALADLTSLNSPITGVFGRTENEKGYRTYAKPGTDELRDSVTAILGAVNNKPWIGPWYAKLAAQWTLENLDLIAKTREQWRETKEGVKAIKAYSAKGKSEEQIEAYIEAQSEQAAIKLITTNAAALSKIKADLGSYQHDVLEALLLDAPISQLKEHLQGVTVDGEPVDVDAISDGILNFNEDFEFIAIMSEATVSNTMYGYAGTLDIILFIKNMKRLSRYIEMTPELIAKAEKQGGLYLLVDLKAGKNLSDEMRGQLAAYRRCDEVWIDDIGTVIPMPEVDACAILHLRQEYERGYKLLQVEEDFDWFLECQDIYNSQNSGSAMHLNVLYPPLEDGSQPLPLIEGIFTPGFGRARGALRRAGFRTLDDITCMTEEELNEFKGLGAAYVGATKTMLESFGLSLKSTNQQEEKVA